MHRVGQNGDTVSPYAADDFEAYESDVQQQREQQISARALVDVAMVMMVVVAVAEHANYQGFEMNEKIRMSLWRIEVT